MSLLAGVVDCHPSIVEGGNVRKCDVLIPPMNAAGQEPVKRDSMAYAYEVLGRRTWFNAVDARVVSSFCACQKVGRLDLNLLCTSRDPFQLRAHYCLM